MPEERKNPIPSPLSRIPSGAAPQPLRVIPDGFSARRADRVIGLMRGLADLQVHVVLELCGQIDEHRLARAVRLLLDQEPVLGCRFVMGRHRPRWERLGDLDEQPLCELCCLDGRSGDEAGTAASTTGRRVASRVGAGEREGAGERVRDRGEAGDHAGERVMDEATESAVVGYLAEPPDPIGRPMLRVRVFRRRDGQAGSGAAGEGGRGGDVVCLKINHLAVDGGGSKQCAYLLAELYEALGRDAELRPAPNLDGSRSMWQLAGQFGWADRGRMLGKALRDRRRRRHPPRFWHVPHREEVPSGAAAGGRTYVLARLSGAAFRRAKEWGRARGATLNDLVNAAYVHALLHRIRPDGDLPLRLRTTVDLRRYLPGGRTGALCNLSSFTYPNLGPARAGGTDFPALVERMSAEMRAQKADWLGLGDWALIGPLLGLVSDPWAAGQGRRHLVPEREPEAFIPSITNIGRIHPGRLGFGDCETRDAFATASVAYPPTFVAGATGCGESLTLSAGFCESGLPRFEAKGLLDHMVSCLASL
jgi:NRPS condensation-like uncharacterized protein